ncbi:ABC transporter permease [Microbacterium sp. SORGH_AS_0862]|uniref:ABC transporter permease n=1 Tax=Microbacterium sp. SORGH_AS_0862 TaxID=3041789 RepID=UPI00278EEB50|nr:hypothetical protein [Microbacterium sp. SORGH_AS_0862]MDQ1204499.1 ABC-type uncharacterized transport system permease subunit [Microbacterium sp. SORGH_AS_0862]
MDFLSSFFTPEMFSNGVRLTTPILFGAIASALSSRAGVLNLAIEAKMLVGAFVGLLALSMSGSSIVAVIAAALAGALTGAMMAVAHRIGVDLIIFAIGLNMLFLELSVYLMRVLFGGTGVWRPDVTILPDLQIPLVSDVPVLGTMLSGYNALVYLALVLAIGYGLLFKFRSGRHLLAVGESPVAALSAGLSVSKVQTWSLVGAGAVAALGGAFLTVGELGLFARDMTEGAGWIAITAALLAMNRPLFLVPAALLFGFSDAFAIRLQSTTDLPNAIVQGLPMIATLAVLGIVGYRGTRRARTYRPSRRRRRVPAAAV